MGEDIVRLQEDDTRDEGRECERTRIQEPKRRGLEDENPRIRENDKRTRMQENDERMHWS